MRSPFSNISMSHSVASGNGWKTTAALVGPLAAAETKIQVLKMVTGEGEGGVNDPGTGGGKIELGGDLEKGGGRIKEGGVALEGGIKIGRGLFNTGVGGGDGATWKIGFGTLEQTILIH